MALILAAVMAVSCLTTILLAASKPWTEIDLGSLSQYYETGTNADPGRISNVDGDSGGTSYGIYMFVEKTVSNFMDWLRAQPDGTTYRAMGDILYNAYAYNTKGEYYPAASGRRWPRTTAPSSPRPRPPSGRITATPFW